ncbi:unnamed protein product [Peniophora sp. CBMAI 1063]|nr:unnamed protein product [Peniophora sp. CBMAI 1063]
MPPPDSPATYKRERSEDGEQDDTTDTFSKRQRVDSPQPDPTDNGDQMLDQNKATDVEATASPLTIPSDEEQDAQVTTKSSRSSSPDESAPTPHERFWFDDGSVVVQVEDVLFRLHKSLLSAQSSYFRDLFAGQISQPTDYDAGSGDTLPLYVLPEGDLKITSVYDVEELLDVLTKPHTNARNHSSTTLYAIARAAHELEFDDTHAWAAQELLDQYWSNDLNIIPSEPRSDGPHAALHVLQVATDAHIPLIRKAALYDVLRLPDFGQSTKTAARLRLADYEILTRARHHCAQVWMDVLTVPPWRSQQCADEERQSKDPICAARSSSQRKHRWNTLIHSQNLRKYWIDPVAGFRHLQGMSIPMDEKTGFCFDCRQAWRNSWKRRLNQLWDELDEVLGLVPKKEAENEVEPAPEA